MIEQTFYEVDGTFRLKEWRNFLTSIVCNLSSKYEVICPFGFEVSGDQRFLKKSLKNFFIYLGTTSLSVPAQQNVSAQFVENLLRALEHHYSIFYQSISAVFTPFCNYNVHSNGDLFLNIKYRVPNNTLLQDYATYIIATVGGVINRQIKALLEFDNDPLSRRYLYQLCIIQNCIFATYGAQLTEKEIRFLLDLIKLLHTSEKRSISRVDSSPSIEDNAALTSIVLPYFHNLYEILQYPRTSKDRLVELSIADYHGYNDLTMLISHDLFINRQQYIVDSYQNFEAI